MAGTKSFALSLSQRALLELLQKCERDAAPVTTETISGATGWKKGTVVTYIGKGHLDAFLTKVSSGSFEVRGALHLAETEFLQALSQKQGARELGFWARSSLTRALLRKARDNMVLALELYNRPSIENRLDAFVILFMTAWEQLLKARLIERDGEATIFKEPRPGKLRETLGFQSCLEKLYPSKDSSVRRNLERLRDLRDDATHLLVPELQSLLSRVFQAGVLNFATAFLDFAKSPFLPRHAVGLLTIVGDGQESSVVKLRASYGRTTGDEVHHLLAQIKAQIVDLDDAEFAIPIRLKLAFSEEGKSGDIVLTKGTDVGERVVVVEKAIDIDKSHPHLEKDAVKEINSRLAKLFSPKELLERLTSEGKPRTRISSWDFQAVVFKESWKKSDRNPHHLGLKNPEIHRYSEEAIAHAVQSISTHLDYLGKARDSYRKRSPGKAKSGLT